MWSLTCYQIVAAKPMLFSPCLLYVYLSIIDQKVFETISSVWGFWNLENNEVKAYGF